jgi:hypothetical protein
MATATKIKFGNFLDVTDEGLGVIRVDSPTKVFAIQVRRNGIGVGSPIVVTTTAATTAFAQALIDTDTLGLVLSSPIGAPTDLSVTLLLEHHV